MINIDHAIEIALLLAVAYLCGCVVGYAARRLLRRARGRARAEPARSEVASAPPSQPSAARRLARAASADPTLLPLPATALRRPPQLAAPRPGGPDDLKAIKGIGIKTEAALNDLGIYHFDQIAAWHPAHVDWLETRIAIKGRIRREQWVEQATLFATAPSLAESPPRRLAG